MRFIHSKLKGGRSGGFRNRFFAYASSAGIVALGLLFPASHLEASVVLSNFSEPALGNPIGFGESLKVAVGMTIKSSPLVFDTFNAELSSNALEGSIIGGGIYLDDGGKPGALYAAFDSVAIPGGSSIAAFGTAAETTLDAGEIYWFLLEADSLENAWIAIPDTPPTGSAAASYVDSKSYTLVFDPTPQWGWESIPLDNPGAPSVAIIADAVPESTTALLACIGVGVLAGLSARKINRDR